MFEQMEKKQTAFFRTINSDLLDRLDKDDNEPCSISRLFVSVMISK